jgi:hypothetical protein
MWERRFDAHAAWARATMKHYLALRAAGTADAAGVGFATGWQWEHSYKDYGFKEDVPYWRRATPAEVAVAAARAGEAFTDGCKFTTAIVDCPTYMRWLMTELARVGGVRFVQG